MSSLPQHIPPQTASLGKADSSGNVTIDVTWYLLLYNLCNQILSPANGSIVASPLDLLSIEGEDTVEIQATKSFVSTVDTADIDALGADIVQLRTPPSSVDPTDFDSIAADIVRVRLNLQALQSLVAQLLDGPSDEIAADSNKLQGATWSAPGAIGTVTPAAVNATGLTATATSTISASGAAVWRYADTSQVDPAGRFGAGAIGTTYQVGYYSGVGYSGFTTVASISSAGVAITGHMNASTTTRTGGYTVATLPSGTQGDRAFVTDATAPTFLGTLTGLGTVVTPVFHNGTAWVAG